MSVQLFSNHLGLSWFHIFFILFFDLCGFWDMVSKYSGGEWCVICDTEITAEITQLPWEIQTKAAIAINIYSTKSAITCYFQYKLVLLERFAEYPEQQHRCLWKRHIAVLHFSVYEGWSLNVKILHWVTYITTWHIFQKQEGNILDHSIPSDDMWHFG